MAVIPIGTLIVEMWPELAAWAGFIASVLVASQQDHSIAVNIGRLRDPTVSDRVTYVRDSRDVMVTQVSNAEWRQIADDYAVNQAAAAAAVSTALDNYLINTIPNIAPVQFLSLTQAASWLEARTEYYNAGYYDDSQWYAITSIYQSEVKRLIDVLYPTATPTTGDQAAALEAIKSSLDLVHIDLINLITYLPAAGSASATDIKAKLQAIQERFDTLNTTATGNIVGGLSGVATALPLVGVTALTQAIAQSQTLGKNMHLGKLDCQMTTGNLIRDLLGTLAAPVAVGALTMGAGGAKSIMGNLAEIGTTWALEPVNSRGVIRPEDAPAVAAEMFAKALQLGSAAHLAAITAEAVAPLKYMGLGYLSAFLADMAGFSKIANSTMGVIEAQTVALPYRYHINKQARPVIPGLGDLTSLYADYHIPLDVYINNLAYNGLSDEWINALVKSAHKPAGFGGLRRLAMIGDYDAALVDEDLRDSGYNEVVIPALTRLVRQTRSDSLLKIYYGPLQRLYRDGYIDQARLTIELALPGKLADIDAARRHALDLDREYEAVTDTAELVLQSYARGLIPESSAYNMLASLGLDGQAATRAITRQRLGLLPRSRLSLPPTIVEEEPFVLSTEA